MSGPGSRLRRRRSLLPAAAEVLVDPRYLTVDRDRQRIREGVRLAVDLLHTDALRGLVQPLLLDTMTRDDDDLDSYIDANLLTYYHPVGTARMGTDEDAVVDSRLRVQGLQRLWVADASVMPHITRSLPQATVIAIAERAAQLIRHELVADPVA